MIGDVCPKCKHVYTQSTWGKRPLHAVVKEHPGEDGSRDVEIRICYCGAYLTVLVDHKWES